jgi:hypothetical protein
VGYGCQIILDPISEKGLGFFIEIDKYWERFERKAKK